MKKRKCALCKRPECTPSYVAGMLPYCQYHAKSKVDFKHYGVPIILTDEPGSCCGLWNCRDCRPEGKPVDPIARAIVKGAVAMAKAASKKASSNHREGK